MARSANQVLALTLRKLSRSENTDGIRRIIQKSHPADLAHVMRSLTSVQQVRVFREIHPYEKAAEVLLEMEPALSERIIGKIDDDFLSILILQMAPDEVASILRTLDTPRKDILLAELGTQEASEAEVLISYENESAGSLMSPNYFAVDSEITAAEAIRKLHENEYDIIFYLYVINEHGQLVGVVSLRELVRASGQTPVKDIMLGDVVRVLVSADQEDVASLVARYNLLALPVIDPGNQLVGVITVDDIIDVIRMEATEDIMHAVGAGVVASPNESFAISLRSRMPWVTPTFVSGLAGMGLLYYYQPALSTFVPLLILIPMVTGIAQHISAQSSTIVTRWLATGRLEFAELRRIIIREMFLGTIIATFFGALIAAVVGIIFKNNQFSMGFFAFVLGVGLSTISATLVSVTIGSMAPLVFKRSGVDPALATGPVVTTLIDVLALWVYLFCLTSFL